MTTNKKIKALTLSGIVVMMAITSLVALTGAASAANENVTVKKDGTGDYTSIQAAVDGTGTNATINVEGGAYYETVNVSSSGVSIVSSDGSQVDIVAHKANGTDAWSYPSGLATTPTLGANVTDYDQSDITVGNSTSSTYASVQNAVNNATAGDKLILEPETYNESVNVTVNYLMLVSSDTSQNATIDATNTSSGVALDKGGNTVEIHNSIKLIDAVLASGGSSGSTSFSLSGTTFGMPNVLWVILAVIGIVVAYTRKEE